MSMNGCHTGIGGLVVQPALIFNDRSNARRAARVRLGAEAKNGIDYYIRDLPNGYFEVVPGPAPVLAGNDPGPIPECLNVSAEQRAAERDASAAAAVKRARDTVTTTAPAAAVPAQKESIMPKTKTAGDRARYDWATAEEKAERGIVPKEPDFSAETHKRFRPLLAQVVAAARAGDLAALKRIAVNPVSTSPRAIDRYRKICMTALKAKAAA